jgi:hypothetical protein
MNTHHGSTIVNNNVKRMEVLLKLVLHITENYTSSPLALLVTSPQSRAAFFMAQTTHYSMILRYHNLFYFVISNRNCSYVNVVNFHSKVVI